MKLKRNNSLSICNGFPVDFGLGFHLNFGDCYHDDLHELCATFIFGGVTLLFWHITFGLQLTGWKIGKFRKLPLT